MEKRQEVDSEVAAAPPEETTSVKTKRRFKFSFPSAFTILFLLTIIAVIATHFVPAGAYSKIQYGVDGSKEFTLTQPTGETKTLPAEQKTLDDLGVKIEIDKFTSGALTKPVSVPGTYQRLESKPAGPVDVFTSMVDGTIEAIDVIVFILVLGGMIGVVRVSGAFESGLVALTKKTKGREFVLIFLVSVFMVVGGSLCGLEEEAVAFYPILCPIFLAMGYDSIICVGAIFLAGSMGTTMSTVNPFSVVIASNAAGIPFTDGLWWRVIGCIVGGAVVIGYLHWYARKIKADPTFSYTYTDKEEFERQWKIPMDHTADGRFSWQKKVILVLFISAFVLMVIGVMKLGWWFPQMAASFLALTILMMFIAATGSERKNEKQLVDAFSAGSASLVAVSLIIGLARGINKILNDGQISDTMLEGATELVKGMHGPVFVIMMLFVFFLLGFVVPSSSGLAVLSMPILAPLADSVGVPRFVIVCAYQWGQYAMLYLAPTGLVMATLQMLDMKFSHWVRFVWPMVVFVLVFGGICLVLQTLIYGV
ncbi:MAG: YfcC family protein [Actinomycetaceae bacterium]|nr:YfcC family protein [Actinomycetaceae bacterium]